VFPHLVAEDLALGIEHTPVDRLKQFIIDPKIAALFGASSTGSSAVATQQQINNANALAQELFRTNNSEVTVTPEARKQRRAARGASKLEVHKFPLDLEQKLAPYVMIKAFGTSVGNEDLPESGDDTVTQSLAAASDVAAAGGRAINETFLGLPGAVVRGTESVINRIGTAIGIEDVTPTLKTAFTNFSLRRNLDQLDDVFVLFMPEGLVANYEHQYEEISVTATLGAFGLGAQALASTKGESQIKDPYLVEAASKSIADKIPGLSSSSELTNLLIFGTTGRALNPQLEVLYTSPRLRTFTFDFRMVPRNANEAIEIKKIVNRLKFLSAPTIPENETGRYLIPPAQFEIEFYHRNKPNKFIFKTKKCVLESLVIDYNANGYATHYDGSPVETRMQVIFKETTIIGRDSILQDF
jgi:hypothetical protein